MKPIIPILWYNKSEYTFDEMKELINVLTTTLDFKPLCLAKFDYIRQNTIQKWSDEQIISIWHTLATQISIKAQKQVSAVPLHELERITDENFLNVCTELQLPPLSLLRRIIAHRYGFSKKMVSQLIKDAPCQIVQVAIENDSESPTKCQVQLHESQNFEKKIEQILRDAGIEFKTQEDLSIKQQQLYGRSILTPDFLLVQPIQFVVIHSDGSQTDSIVNWIDAKNYLWVNQTNLGNVKKYVEEFGHGALVFRYGFLVNLQMPGITMLSF